MTILQIFIRRNNCCKSWLLEDHTYTDIESISSGGPSKSSKRDHDCVSPVSPQMSQSDFRRILNEGLNPINTELDGIKKSIESMRQEFSSERDSIKSSADTNQARLW